MRASEALKGQQLIALSMVKSNPGRTSKELGSIGPLDRYQVARRLPGFQQVAKLQTAEGFKTAGMNWSDQTKRGQDFTRIAAAQTEGSKCGGAWFGSYAEQKALGTISPGRMHGSKSNARKAASAMIAKIPFVLGQHIARAWKPSLNDVELSSGGEVRGL
jgi:hypothetical protein